MGGETRITPSPRTNSMGMLRCVVLETVANEVQRLPSI